MNTKPSWSLSPSICVLICFLPVCLLLWCVGIQDTDESWVEVVDVDGHQFSIWGGYDTVEEVFSYQNLGWYGACYFSGVVDFIASYCKSHLVGFFSLPWVNHTDKTDIGNILTLVCWYLMLKNESHYFGPFYSASHSIGESAKLVADDLFHAWENLGMCVGAGGSWSLFLCSC